MLSGLDKKAAIFPNTGIPMLTDGGASLGFRRKADIKAIKMHATSAPPARRAVCGISRTASMVTFDRVPSLRPLILVFVLHKKGERGLGGVPPKVKREYASYLDILIMVNPQRVYL